MNLMLVRFKSALEKPSWSLVLGFVFILAYYSPFIYYGENSFVRIHDNLDSNIAWVKMLLDNQAFFSSPITSVQQVFNGVPRSSLYGTYDISILWFSLFGMYGGYVVNKVIMSLVAFVGMYLLLKKYFLNQKAFEPISCGASILFSLLPFWSFTLSVSGLPLLLYAFLGIRKGERHYVNWIIIVVLAFYSSLILSGLFILIVLSLVLLHDLIRERKFNFSFFYAIGLLAVLYLVGHFPLVYSFLFDSDYVSHRTEFHKKPWNLSEACSHLETILRYGQHHAHSLHEYLLIPVLVALILRLITRKPSKKYILVLVFILLTSFLYAAFRWEAVSDFFVALTSLLPIQLQRFHFLHPMLWYVLFALALATFFEMGKIGRWVAFLLLSLQLGFIISKHEFLTQNHEPTYKQFYSVNLFDKVKKTIGDPVDQYRVISLGIHPSIAQYNGFYTLDGYLPNYPLQHKHEFGRVIEGELKKDAYLTYYFKNWGSRCYAFTKALRTNYLNPNPKIITALDFDFKALKKMGGRYLLSSAEIDSKAVQDIRLVGVFQDPDSYWDIYLYENVSEAQ
ncbi:DUF6044 family protein [Spongiimicrobium sp. 2-473A-2-J]|uniref:DUF6044 family protein n=1 Tax=Eudoraea algarum TaxID=3417568 RepID=UPI003D36361E